MKKLVVFISVLCCLVVSCTLDKTDYRAEIDTIVPEHTEFKEVASMDYGDYHVTLNALNGTLYKGHNEIRVQIKNKHSGQREQVSEVTFFPVRTMEDGGSSSCPHRYNLNFQPEGNLFTGYAVFTHESNAQEKWELYLNFTAGGETYKIRQPVSVQQQSNKNLNMTAFTGNDGHEYLIALVSPQKPKVAENKLIAGVYRLRESISEPVGAFPDSSMLSYSEVRDYTLLLDPRMPEPSMGNHSSPNNIDLKQGEDGLYHGVVNYTMTGNWTLNFIMLNQQGKILKGTVVPDDFTPGVEGVKSELRIDILF